MPDDVFREVFHVLTNTRCIPTFDDQGDLTIEPLTYEEATVLGAALTGHIVSNYERKTP